MSVIINCGIPAIPKQYLECIGQGNIISNSQDFDMTGMDSSLDFWYLLLIKLINPTGGIADYYVYFDDDYTDTNYYSQYLAATGNTVLANRLNTPNFAGVTTLQNIDTHMEIFQDVTNYTRCISYSSRYAPNICEILRRDVVHNVAGSFTKIRLHSSVANGIGAGSKLALYRYKRLI